MKSLRLVVFIVAGLVNVVHAGLINDSDEAVEFSSLPKLILVRNGFIEFVPRVSTELAHEKLKTLALRACYEDYLKIYFLSTLSFQGFKDWLESRNEGVINNAMWLRVSMEFDQTYEQILAKFNENYEESVSVLIPGFTFINGMHPQKKLLSLLHEDLEIKEFANGLAIKQLGAICPKQFSNEEFRDALYLSMFIVIAGICVYSYFNGALVSETELEHSL